MLPVDRVPRDPQQWNRYAYALNNPLIYSEPDGRELRDREECLPACAAPLALDVIVVAPQVAVVVRLIGATVTAALTLAAASPIIQDVVAAVEDWVASSDTEAIAPSATGSGRGGEAPPPQMGAAPTKTMGRRVARDALRM